MELKLEPRKVALTFLAIIVVLTLINLFAIYVYFSLDSPGLTHFLDSFDFTVEGNIPTFYSAVAMLVCAALLALIALAVRDESPKDYPYWMWLAIIFVFLAVDEAVALHEHLTHIMGAMMEARGFLYFLWVVPYGIGTILLGLVYLKFVLALPEPTRRLFIVSGAVYLAGALGFEMWSARETDLHGADTLAYNLISTVEEFLEMLGINVFIYSLMSHLARITGRFAVVVEIPTGQR